MCLQLFLVMNHLLFDSSPAPATVHSAHLAPPTETEAARRKLELLEDSIMRASSAPAAAGGRKAYDGQKGKALGKARAGTGPSNEASGLISGVFRFGMSATKIAKADIFDETDGFVVVSMENDARDGWDYVYRTEVQPDCRSPDWELWEIDSFGLCKNEADRMLRFELYDWDSDKDQVRGNWDQE
jgi:hypothetical protein